MSWARRFPPTALLRVALLLAVLTTCDAPTAPSRSSGSGRIGLTPQFSREAALVAGQLADFGLAFDNVRIVISRPIADTLKDTTVVFRNGQPDFSVDLSLAVRSIGEVFDATVAYRQGSTELFTGSTRVVSRPLDQPGSPATIVVNYTGPGAAVARLAITPKNGSALATTTTTLTVQAFDSLGNAMAQVPIKWSTSDTAVATIAAAGAQATVQPSGRRGKLTITALTPTGVTDQSALALTLPPATIALVSGGGQTGAVGSGLPNPAVVQVRASDGVGVSGVSVTFTPPAGGGVGSLTIPTDTNGLANTSLTLGRIAGTQSFTAAAGALTVNIPAIGTAGPPVAIAVVSGGSQTDTVRKRLAAPLVVVVTDQFGNVVPGAVVSWAQTGGGTLGAASSTTGSDGQTSIAYTLGATAGSETVTATVTGAAGPLTATFAASAVVGPIAALQFTTQPSTAGAGAAISPAVQVGTFDAFGNPAPTAAAITIALGGGAAGAVLAGTLTRNTVAGIATFGDLAINKAATGYTLTATIAALTGVQSVSGAFNVTVTAPATLTKSAGDAQTVAAGAQVPVGPAVTVTDASGNPVAGVSVTFTAAAGSGSVAGADGVSNTAAAVTTNAQGFAALTRWTAGTVAGANALTVTAGALSSVAFSATVTPGPAYKLAIVTPPPSGATSGLALAPSTVIQIQDQYGNAVAQATTDVTVTTAGATLSGTTTVATDATGEATFTSLVLTGSGSVTLTFAATGLASVASGTITLGAGAPAKLAFVQQPTNVATGATISPAVTLQIQDANGTLVSNATNVVTLAISAGTGTAGAVPGGTLNVAAVGGVATFSNLSISLGGTGYTLTATSGSLTAATSNPFNVTGSAGPATIAIVSGNNQVALGTRFFWGLLKVVVKDGGGVPVAAANVTFTVTGGGGKLGGSIPQQVTSQVVSTGADGVATSSIWWPGSAAGPQAVTATVTGLTPVTFAGRSAGTYNGFGRCELRSTGAAFCWGDNTHGQIGDGTTTNRNVPTAVAAGPLFQSLAEGSADHACGLTPSGQAYCWGANDFGQLGDGTTVTRTTPVAVTGGHQFVELVVSTTMTCGLSNAGALTCWGGEGPGLFGDGAQGGIRPSPTAVLTGGLLFDDVSLSELHACAVATTTEAMYCWGYNGYGELGDGTFNNHTVPTAVGDGRTYVAVTVGAYHSCGLTNAGAAFCWGLGQYGAIGNGLTNPFVSAPTAVVGGIAFSVLSAGGAETCGFTDAGQAYCWGGNSFGGVGDGTTTQRNSPTPVQGSLLLSTLHVRSGGLGAETVCGLTWGNQLYCWGAGYLGQIGNGSSTTSNPVPVAVPNWLTATSLTVSAGDNQSAMVGTAVAIRPAVIARDDAGFPVPGVSVTFAATSGGGSVTGATAVTNASGIATVGSWTLGASPGGNTLTASANGLTPATFTATATVPNPCDDKSYTVGTTVNEALGPSSCGGGSDYYTYTTTAATSVLTFHVATSAFTPVVIPAIGEGGYWYTGASVVGAFDVTALLRPDSYRMIVYDAHGTKPNPAAAYTLSSFPASSLPPCASGPNLYAGMVIATLGVSGTFSTSGACDIGRFTDGPPGTYYGQQLFMIGPPGATLTVHVTSSAFSPLIEVNKDGDLLCSSSGQTGSTVTASCSLPTGLATVRVTSLTPGQTGTYTITIDP